MRYTTETFIDKANKVHKGLYSYEKSIYCGYGNNVIITNPEKNNQEEFYVRRNASAIGLTMYEMLNYSKENWE